MTGRRRLAFRALLVLGPPAVLSGCACTSELRPSVVVEVHDAVTGMPAARGVTGISEHESGVLTDLYAIDDLRLEGDWSRELPGRHTILVRKPGYLPDVVVADAGAGICHVNLETVEARIARDAGAVSEYAVSFIEEPGDSDWPPASAEVHVHGDTLEIVGFAHTECTELRVVAFRSVTGLHVQVEPSDITLDSCHNSRQFEARFTLPSESTRLLLTNGFLYPVELFEGSGTAEQGKLNGPRSGGPGDGSSALPE